jgi:hypothetical protein
MNAIAVIAVTKTQNFEAGRRMGVPGIAEAIVRV